MVYRNGPAAVAMDAKSPELKYARAPFTSLCGTAVDHAVLLVGWDDSNWIIKNSWGPTWGNEGFLYLPRGENKCGINSMLGQPIIKRANY